MTLDALIQKLTDLREEHGGDIDVRLAQQPRWALQYEVGAIAVAGTGDEDEEDMTPADEAALICYIGEGSAIHDDPYLGGAAAEALGWGR